MRSCSIFLRWVCILLLLINVVYGQEPVHRLLTNANGLPSNTVYNCLQDSKGFVWIGHDKGMSRYDGKQFVHYTANAKQGRSLSNIIELNGVIWCQDFSGNYYYVSADTLLSDATIVPPSFFSPAVGIGKSSLAVVDAACFRLFNTVTRKQTKLPLQKGFCSFGIAVEGASGYMYLNDALFKINESGYTKVQAVSNINKSFFHFKKFGNKLLLFTKDSYPYVYQINGNQIVPILNVLPKDIFIQDVSLVNNELWICTSSGAYCFDANLQPKYSGKVFFGRNSITHVMMDAEGTYWFCTINKGLLLVDNIYSIILPFGDEVFTTIANAKNQLILGTNTHKIVAFKNGAFKPLLQLPNNHEVVDVLVNDEQNLLVTSSSVVNVYKNGKQISSISLAGKKSVLLNPSTIVTAFSSGVQLIATNANQPVQCPPWLQNTPYAKYQNGNWYIVSDVRCRYLALREEDSTLFVATAKGLYFFSPRGYGKVQYNGKPIFASQVLTHKKNVYVGTYNDGLYMIKDTTVAAHYSFVNNQISNAIYKLKQNGDYLWMIGDEQLVKMHLGTKKITYVSSASGIPKAEIKDIAFQNNQLFVATSMGLVVLPEQDEQLNPVPPRIYINKAAANGVNIPWVNNATLPANVNSLQFAFSVVSFKGDEKQLVQYRINTSNWVTIEPGARTLDLPKLAPGAYNIELRAFNEAGVVSQENVCVQFTISAPFYQSIWFYVVVLLIITSLVYGYFKWQLRLVKASNKLLSEKISLENALHKSVLASIKSQMNPHFIFNALNTIQAYIYTSDKKNASTYLSKFSALTRMILDMSNKEVVSLSEEIKSLQLYLELEQLRFEDKLSYTVNIQESLSQESMYLPSMLIQPYVENAIKHGLLHSKNKWQLHIAFSSTPSGVLVCIDDNGIGRKKSMQLNKLRPDKHISFAAKANATRLELLNRGLKEAISLDIIDKYDDAGNAIGTKVLIHIPTTHKKNFTPDAS
ncbi:MAG: hypothetical protein EAY72_03990 [Bacteroidetes bacterium]|nr:MAG: hypothetical protein EAY72_03990 [Bacteroidota bacterium]